MNKPQVIVYYLPSCPWCHKAFDLLKRYHIQYQAIDITAPAKRNEMIRRTGRTSVPQIFIKGYHIGGYDDLNKLLHRLANRGGKLKK